jgi:F-type H+-transporting ATPase subunit b
MGPLPLLHFNHVTFLFAFAVFAALWLILSTKVWKPVLKALDERDEAIRSDLDQAKLSKEEAEKLLQEQRLAMENLREEGRRLKDEAIALADKHKHELLAAAQKEAEQLLVKARNEIQIEKENMLEDVKTLAIEIGVDLASKILVKEMDPAAHKASIKDSLSQLEGAYRKAV